MSDVYISGIGIVSSLGTTYKEHKKNLFAVSEGISKQHFSNNGFSLDSFTGSVSNEISIPDQYEHETKNFKFAFSAFSSAVAELEEGFLENKKVAICLGTSLGGKVAGQEALYNFNNGTIDDISVEKLEKRSIHHIADELIAYYDINASYYVISTACSASNNAVILGTQLLQDNQCDIAICGGCDELCDISLAGFTSLGAINKDMGCQPYSLGKGISLGEGAGFIVLTKQKELAKYGKIIGGKITSDAYHITAPKATGEGAAKIADFLFDKAEIMPVDIDYVNGHGTGTSANDTMEKNLLSKVFPISTLISSTKGQTGHTLGAAGIIELINCIASIEEQQVPATKNEIGHENFPTNFIFNQPKKSEIRNVINFSFAFGGNNSGVLLSSLNSELSTFPFNQVEALQIVSSASTVDFNSDTYFENYDKVTHNFSAIQSLRYTQLNIPKNINPAQYRKMDNFSKMVTIATEKAISKSGLNLKKMDLNKVGIVFVTPSGPVEVVESIEEQLFNEGYHQVSAAKFPFTVMNASAGMLSLLYKITGPVSVIATNAGAIDGFLYAKQMMQNDDLDYVLLVSANQWTELSVFSWDKLGYDSTAFTGADFCSVQLLTNKNAQNGSAIKKSIQIKRSNKNRPHTEIVTYYNNELSNFIQTLELQNVKGIVWNSSKKTDTPEYSFLHSLSETVDYPIFDCSELGFSSDGAGEEIDYLMNGSFDNGDYIVISYSRFGGVSFAVIDKQES